MPPLLHYSEGLMRWNFQTTVHCRNPMQYSAGEVGKVWYFGLTNSEWNANTGYCDWAETSLWCVRDGDNIYHPFDLHETDEMM